MGSLLSSGMAGEIVGRKGLKDGRERLGFHSTASTCSAKRDIELTLYVTTDMVSRRRYDHSRPCMFVHFCFQ